MPEPDPRLHALTGDATVHFLADGGQDGRIWGSGFFVAPGWVLTAAHVLQQHLMADRDLVFAVRGSRRVNGGLAVPARLEQWLLSDPRAATVPMGEDLALVRLAEDGVDHPCVWLADRAVRHFGPARVYGYRPSGGAAASWSAEVDISIHDDRYGLRFTDVELPFGVSGGPLLDPTGGAVVALVKAKRQERDGGLAVSVAALRRFGPTYRKVIAAHDKWHGLRALGGEESWVQAQHRVVTRGRNPGGGEWTPRDREKALRHLAALPPPPDGPTVAALARQARSGSVWPQETPELHTWRDGHGLLLEGTGPLDSLTGLRYLRLVSLYVTGSGAAEGVTGALDEWIVDRLADHPWRHLHALVSEARLPRELPPAAVAGARRIVPYPGRERGTTVAVLLDPVIGADPAHFFWQILIDRGDEGTVLFATDSSMEGHRSDELVQALRPSLTEAFHMQDEAGRPVPLEVALPAEHFDMAVHRWRFDDIAELYNTYHLGAQRRVVLRCLARRGDPDELWAERWRAARAQRKLEGWRVPLERGVPAQRQFVDAPAAAVPVICRSVGQGTGRAAMRLALQGGHGLALWRVDGHSGGCTDGCDDLHARVKGLLTSVAAVDELPDVMRGLRQEISVQRTAQRWAEPLALLYDDPGRPLPGEDSTFLDAPQ